MPARNVRLPFSANARVADDTAISTARDGDGRGAPPVDASNPATIGLSERQLGFIVGSVIAGWSAMLCVAWVVLA